MARSKRIEFLSELTKGFDTVLDIGTDHGFVLERAFQKNYIKQGLAADLRVEPLNQAKKTLKNYPVTFHLSDGFLSVKEDFDLAIIAGMGAHLIARIMEHAPYGSQTYLLQANEKIEALRTYLADHHFKIIDEYVVKDNFFYVILKVVRGEMTLTEEELYVGPILKTKPEATSYFQRKAKQYQTILSQTSEDQKAQVKKVLHYYEKVIYDKI